MKVRIIPRSVPLPHTITSGGVSYQLAPEADVPDEYGKALIRTHPKIFTEGGKGPIDMTAYTFREAFKKQQISDVVAKLSDEQKLKVFNFAQAVLEGKDQESEGDGPPAGLTEEEQVIVDAFRAMSDEDKSLTIKYVEKKV